MNQTDSSFVYWFEEIMNDQIDTIQEIEEAIVELQALSDPQDPILESEIRRLDHRLRRIEELQPVFSQPV